jgi:hypothetical protein
VDLYRDDYYDHDGERPGEMDILIRKNRRGRLGSVVVEQGCAIPKPNRRAVLSDAASAALG